MNGAREERGPETFGETLARVTQAPRVVPALIVLNVAAFVALALAGGGVLDARPEVAVRWGSNFGPLTTGGEWWRLASSTFIHYGILHLAVNMAVLWDAGRLAERLFGSVHFLVIYAASGVAGALVSVAWNPWVNSAGASGAIFGVLGALLAYLVDQRNRVPPSVLRRHVWTALLFVGYSLAYGLAATNVDNAGHLGGLTAGFGLGFLLALPLSAGRPRWSPARVAVAAIASAAVLAIPAQFVRNTGPAYRAERALSAALDELIAESRRMEEAGETARGALARFERGEIPVEGLTRVLEDEAAFYDRARARLLEFQLDPSSPSKWRFIRDTLVAAFVLRGDALRLQVGAINEDDIDRSKEAARKMAESDALLGALRADPRAGTPAPPGPRVEVPKGR